MVSSVLLLLLACGGVMLVLAAPLPLAEDGGQRSERSANLSHITGTARKVRMYMRNHILQILPDGTVNGTTDDTSHYSILQRQSVGVGQVKIQGVATCIYLCMDSCGLIYGSREFAEDCVFNEMIEQNQYNTYSSTKYSNQRRTVYVALNRRGAPRRVQIKAKSPLGKLSAFTRVLPRSVPADQVEQLAQRLLQQHPGTGAGAPHHLRHHQLCPPAAASKPVPETADVERCRKRKKRRKRRRCREGEDENEECHKVKEDGKKRTVIVRKKCEEAEGKEKCQQKKQHMIGRKRKSRHDTKRLLRHLHPRGHQRSEEEDSEEMEHDHEDVTAAEEEESTTIDGLLDANDK